MRISYSFSIILTEIQDTVKSPPSEAKTIKRAILISTAVTMLYVGVWVWRSAFVVLTTIISMLLPFFNDVVGILGAFGFWPLTVYFPVEMYIAQKKIRVVLDLKVYRPFKTSY
ncbi:hypothetical protein RD792_017031 [Penstemon davidsonii]|uniref:Amino acid transporter transmembrane domain-containing protein n=1 Tax=Penstemon davidsonii TaxID=160366 RepID=A0ABR0CKW7_9LAMI|nr:hypothetical protein RD792_017031 [Penstemon davidsonii]